MRRLYFVQAGKDGPIKIGVATNTAERIIALQTASPFQLTLLADCAGDLGEERALHAELAKFRLTGEWFLPSREVLAVVQEARSLGIKRAPVEKTAAPQEISDDAFMRRSFSWALKIAFPGEHQVQDIAQAAAVTKECARNWLINGRLPHSSQLINLCASNEIIHAWIKSTFHIYQVAHERGISPDEALIQIDRERS